MANVPTTYQVLQRTAPPPIPGSEHCRTIRPFDKQIEASEIVDANTLTLYGGAVRGGKSYFMLLKLFSLSQEWDNSRWLIMRADMPRFEQTTLRSFEELLDKGVGQYLYKWNKRTNTVTWKNGSQFVFMAESYSVDKSLMRLHGFECNGCGLDEVNELQETTLDKVIERSGSWFHAKRNAAGLECPTKIIMTCNPSNNWVKTRFYDKWEREQLAKPGPRLPEGQAYVPSRIYDNPHVPASYLNNLRTNMRAENFTRFVDGDWNYTIKTGKEWTYNFDSIIHTGECNYIRDYPVSLSFDFNQKPYMSMLGIQFLEMNGVMWIRVFDEYALPTPYNTPEFCCQFFKRDYIDTFGFVPVSIYGDPSGKNSGNSFRGIFEEMAAYMFNESNQVLNKAPFLSDARDLINAILGERKYPIRILIDREHCPNLIKDLDSLQEGIKGFDAEVKDNVETKGHMYSALVYCICKVYAHLLRANKEPY